jgi:hypothetical protein
VARKLQQRAEDGRQQLLGVAHQRRKHPLVRPPVGTADRSGGRRERAVEDYRRAVVERVRERDLGLHQLQPVPVERKLAQERRGERMRVDGRADVMDEAREGELGRARPSPHRGLRLQHPH